MQGGGIKLGKLFLKLQSYSSSYNITFVGYVTTSGLRATDFSYINNNNGTFELSEAFTQGFINKYNDVDYFFITYRYNSTETTYTSTHGRNLQMIVNNLNEGIDQTISCTIRS